MRRRFLVLVFVLMFFTPCAVGMFESTSTVDEVDDGLDNMLFYTDGTRVPAPLMLDVVNVGSSLSDTTLSIQVECAGTIPDVPYSLQIALDTDQSQVTGESAPEWYYNQLGVDYLIEVDSNGGLVQGAISEYQGVWIESGAPLVVIESSTITVSFDLSQIGGSQRASYMVYIVQGIAVDMTPEEGKPPLYYIITEQPPPEEPAIIIITPEPVEITPIIEHPLVLEEGTPFQLDSSATILDPTMAPYVYEWDLDGDGVYEVSTDSPVYAKVYEQDGVYPISLRITDTGGISGEATETLTVQNTPPYNVEIISPQSMEIGETITLVGSAIDKGNDPLIYSWLVDGVTLTGNLVTTSFETSGVKTITLTVTDTGGATAQTSDVVTVNEAPEQEPELDPFLILLIILFGFGGFFLYNWLKKKKEEEKPKDDDKKKKKGYCEEHPEVVEQENKACESAIWDLDSTIGGIQDNLDDKRDQWRDDIRDVSRAMMEWDIAYAMIQSLTKSEAEIKKDSETVQKIAGILKTGGSMGKTAFKEGGEKAMKEVAKYVASEIGKNIAGEVSSTINDVLSLETWAYSEIGIGIAKLLTGIDPRKEASDIRKESLRTVNQLARWVDPDLGRGTGGTTRTLQVCIDEAQQLLDDIDKALEDFENKVSGFVCVTCEIPDFMAEEIDKMIKEINGFMKTFGDLIDQVTQRLDQAAAMLSRKDVYEDPYTWVHAQNNEVADLKHDIKRAKNARKK